MQPVHDSRRPVLRAILEDGPVPVPLEDAIKNMAVIDAILRSAKTGRWEQPDAGIARPA